MVNQRTLIVMALVSNAKLVVLAFQVTRSLIQFWPLMNNRVAQWKSESQEKYFKIFYIARSNPKEINIW